MTIKLFENAFRRKRQNYHVTLGGLLAFLEKNRGFYWIREISLGDKEYPLCGFNAHSYRGFNADLALIRTAKPRRPQKENLEKLLKEVKGTYFFNGGEHYYIDEDAPLWIVNDDDALGRAILGVNTHLDEIRLFTKWID